MFLRDIREREEGAALVEAAMVTPILLLLINVMILLTHALGHAPLLNQMAFDAYMAGARAPVNSRADVMETRVNSLLLHSPARFGQVSEETTYPGYNYDTSDRTVDIKLSVDVLSLGGVSQPVMKDGSIARRRLTNVAWSLSGPLLLPRVSVDANMTHFADPDNAFYDCNGNRANSAPTSCG